MDTLTIAPVIVGADGTPAGLNSVRYAALEAARLGASLQIVHVTPSYPQLPPGRPVVPPQLRQTSLAILRSATDAALAAAPVDVHGRLLAGSPAQVLSHLGDEAQLLVLGSERRSLVDRIWTGAVASRVSAHADCRVVVVPAEWDPTDLHHRVVLGLGSTGHCAGLLEAGMEIAAGRDAELVVVHAWRLPSGYDDIIEMRVAGEELRQLSLTTIQPRVDTARRGFPDLKVRVEVVHGQAAHVLVEAAAEADLVLLRRPVHGPVRHHLGSTGRAVLREARCAVEVIPAA